MDCTVLLGTMIRPFHRVVVVVMWDMKRVEGDRSSVNFSGWDERRRQQQQEEEEEGEGIRR